jgi:hypothetical protein
LIVLRSAPRKLSARSENKAFAKATFFGILFLTHYRNFWQKSCGSGFPKSGRVSRKRESFLKVLTSVVTRGSVAQANGDSGQMDLDETERRLFLPGSFSPPLSEQSHNETTGEKKGKNTICLKN